MRDQLTYPSCDSTIQLLSERRSLLGKLLGNIIKKHEGEDVYDVVESIRRLTKHHQAKNSEISDLLVAALRDVRDADLLAVTRAFAHFLHLSNVVERYYCQQHQVFLFEARECCPDQEGFIDSEKLNIELVLTAHPSEILRRTYVKKYRVLEGFLAELDKSEEGASRKQRMKEIERISRKIELLIEQLWLTPDFRETKPTPIDEVKWGLDVVESSLWYAVPKFLRSVFWSKSSLNFKSSLGLTFSPVRFASWIGGDRDGNPNVTAAITKHALLLQRQKALFLYRADLRSLYDELSFSICDVNLSSMTAGSVEPYRYVLDDLIASVEESIALVSLSLEDHLDRQLSISSSKNLILPLWICYESLMNVGLRDSANGRLLDLVMRIQTFGLYLMPLDLRQNQQVHAATMAEYFKHTARGEYLSWPEDLKQQCLIETLESDSFIPASSWVKTAQSQETMTTIKLLSSSQQEGIASYIVSMAGRPSHLLEVAVLFKLAGVDLKIPLVPLFETLEDLENSANTIRELLRIDAYKSLLVENQQVVMIGYSDSAKDAGILAAGWHQYKAQESVLSVGREENVDIHLFHGRGGTVGRGGAPAKAALLSQPAGSLASGLRVTVQGEMIQAQLGTINVACASLFRYAESITSANRRPPPTPALAWRKIMDRLTELSSTNYRSRVKGNRDFLDYFSSATPILELANLPIGSRPVKRNSSSSIDAIRAIPWIFAWSQNRLMLPSWLGAGEALKQIIEEQGVDMLVSMAADWPFFSTRLALLEMVYIKSSRTISEHFEKNLVPQKLHYIGSELREQLADDINSVLSIKNKQCLMQNAPFEKEIISRRRTYTDPLNIFLAELLRRQRLKKEPVLAKTIDVCISGVAAGMRNTG